MKILVRGTNWIGDAVMSVPAFRRLRASFPEAQITLLTRDWAHGIFEDADFIDDIILIDSRRSAAASIIEQRSKLRPRRFDVAVVLPNSFESAFGARISRARRVFGYATDGRGFLITDRVRVPDWKNSRHEVFYYLELIAAVETAFDRPPPAETTSEPELPISEERKGEAREILKGFGCDLTRPVVTLAAGSKNSRAKRWGSAKFAELADRLFSSMGAVVVLLGASDEADVSAAVKQNSQASLFDLTGKTDLAQAAAILAISDLLVANDMGLAHLAPASGTPAIVIFGPTDPMTTAPMNANSITLTAGVECSPCMLRDCPIDHRCMTRISVDSVFEKAVQLIELKTQK